MYKRSNTTHLLNQYERYESQYTFKNPFETDCDRFIDIGFSMKYMTYESPLKNIDFKVFGHNLGFKKYFLFIFLSENGHFCGNWRKFGLIYHETFTFVKFFQLSQLSVLYKTAGFQHCFSRANASISKSNISKELSWGLNIIMKMDLR